MIFHGKQTVPSKLRKDMWLPFYSVHFDNAKQGLRAYHLLREFSLQRQLSPPLEMITVTKQLLDWKRPTDPHKAKEFDAKYVHQIGQLMPRQWRKRAVMDQRATSVADIAAVIAIQEQEIKNGFGKPNRKYRTLTARRRRRAARQKEFETRTKHRELVAEFEKEVLNSRNVFRLPRNVADNVEFKIRLDKHDPNSEYHLERGEVKVFWSDIHDAQYAESWPERVIHGELDATRDPFMMRQKLRTKGAGDREGEVADVALSEAEDEAQGKRQE